MANVQIKDGAEAEKYLKSTGAGSDGDAYIPQHLETNSADIKTAVELLDNAISGSEMQVDVVTLPALVAGSAAIGKLAANSGVDIGDVDITSISAGDNNIGNVDIASAIPAGDNNIGNVDIASSIPAGTNGIGKLTANSGVDIGDVTLTAGSASIGTLGANSGVDIGDVTLNAGSASIGTLGANSGVDIGDVDVTSLPSLPAGTNGIGKLTANSGVDIGDVTLTAGSASIGTLGANSGVDIGDVTLNAGTAEVGKVTSLLATDSLRNGTTSVTPAFVAINAASSGDNTLLAAAGSSNKIRVLAMNIVVGAEVNVRVESGAGGTAMTGIYEFNGKGDGLVLPFSPVGWFETAANTLLNLELSGAVSVDGSFVYVVVQ